MYYKAMWFTTKLSGLNKLSPTQRNIKMVAMEKCLLMLLMMISMGQCKYMEGELNTGDNWAFLARFCFLSLHGKFEYDIEYPEVSYMVILLYGHIWSYVHAVIHSRGYMVICSYGHTVIWSYDHLVLWSYVHRSYGHMVIQSSGHMVIQLYGHIVIGSYIHPVIQSYSHPRSYGHTVIQHSNPVTLYQYSDLCHWKSWPLLWHCHPVAQGVRGQLQPYIMQGEGECAAGNWLDSFLFSISL